jgi:hypothetical protein
MLAPGFAHRIVGLVHVSNRLQRRAPLDDTQPLDLATQVQDEPEHADGARFVSLDVTLQQRGQVALSCQSRYLSRRGHHGERAPTSEPDATMPLRAEWALPQDAGRRYAALSGDWNPIHLWGWSARLFGLRQPIIHGAHSMARAQAELERLGGRPLQTLALDPAARAAGQHTRSACGPGRTALRAARGRPARRPAPGTTEGRTRYRAG